MNNCIFVGLYGLNPHTMAADDAPKPFCLNSNHSGVRSLIFVTQLFFIFPFFDIAKLIDQVVM
jgi:hypothetical protein